MAEVDQLIGGQALGMHREAVEALALQRHQRAPLDGMELAGPALPFARLLAQPREQHHRPAHRRRDGIGRFGNRPAAPFAGAQHAVAGQFLQGGADRPARHVELFAERQLGRQDIAGPELALLHPAPDHPDGSRARRLALVCCPIHRSSPIWSHNHWTPACHPRRRPPAASSGRRRLRARRPPQRTASFRPRQAP